MSLFSAEPENACQAYTNLRKATEGSALAAREHCEDLWRDYEEFADDNFESSFPVQLHERWFEMYLTVTLLRAGHNVSCPKFKTGGPDILLTMDNRKRVWIEATCATPGRPGEPDSVPEPRFVNIAAGEKPVVTSRPTEQMVLRLRSALSAKESKFRKYLEAGTVEAADVLAVAINVHAVYWAFADMDELMKRALYGQGNIVLTVSRETRKIVDSHHEQVEHIAKKKTGEPVGVRPFIDQSLPHISAVLGSRADAANLPRQLGGDLSLFPNLTAQVGWQASTIRLGEEWAFAQVDGGWDGKRVSYAAS